MRRPAPPSCGASPTRGGDTSASSSSSCDLGEAPAELEIVAVEGDPVLVAIAAIPGLHARSVIVPPGWRDGRLGPGYPQSHMSVEFRRPVCERVVRARSWGRSVGLLCGVALVVPGRIAAGSILLAIGVLSVAMLSRSASWMTVRVPGAAREVRRRPAGAPTRAVRRVLAVVLLALGFLPANARAAITPLAQVPDRSPAIVCGGRGVVRSRGR